MPLFMITLFKLAVRNDDNVSVCNRFKKSITINALILYELSKEMLLFDANK